MFLVGIFQSARVRNVFTPCSCTMCWYRPARKAEQKEMGNKICKRWNDTRA